MSFKVTALQDVTFHAIVPKGGHPPGSQGRWITLHAGEVARDISIVHGVHPRHFPREVPMTLDGVKFIDIGQCLPGDLPKEFFGLFRLEVDR